MARIIGAKIQEHVKVGNGADATDLNRVEFRVILRETATDSIGEDIARYVVQIPELRQVFEKDPRDFGGVRALCESFLNRECFLETKAKAYDGKLTQTIVHCVFLDEYAKSGK